MRIASGNNGERPVSSTGGRIEGQNTEYGVLRTGEPLGHDC